MVVARSATRVRDNTADRINRRIDQVGEAWVTYCAAHPELIDGRLEELDREWDIERAIQANAAGLCMLGVVLGAVSSRKWFLIPGVVGGFLMQHAVQGWCPPIPVLRRLGFRTRGEIDQEKFALKALRGDLNVSGERGRAPGNAAGGGMGGKEPSSHRRGSERGSSKRAKEPRAARTDLGDSEPPDGRPEGPR